MEIRFLFLFTVFSFGFDHFFTTDIEVADSIGLQDEELVVVCNEAVGLLRETIAASSGVGSGEVGVVSHNSCFVKTYCTLIERDEGGDGAFGIDKAA